MPTPQLCGKTPVVALSLSSVLKCVLASHEQNKWHCPNRSFLQLHFYIRKTIKIFHFTFKWQSSGRIERVLVLEQKLKLRSQRGGSGVSLGLCPGFYGSLPRCVTLGRFLNSLNLFLHLSVRVTIVRDPWRCCED